MTAPRIVIPDEFDLVIPPEEQVNGIQMAEPERPEKPVANEDWEVISIPDEDIIVIEDSEDEQEPGPSARNQNSTSSYEHVNEPSSDSSDDDDYW